MAKRTRRARSSVPGFPVIRPFRYWDPDAPLPNVIAKEVPTCGMGKEKQIDIHRPGDPPTMLFSIPRRRTNMYFPELVELSRKMNTMFARVVRDGLRRRRRQFGLPNLQFTIALVDGGAYLTYADPVKKGRRRK